MNRLEEALALDPNDRYAANELRAAFAPRKPVVRCMSASQVTVGMMIHSNSKVASNQGVFEVVSSQSRTFDGALMIKVQGTSRNGVEFRTVLTYLPDEAVEVVG